MFVLAAAGGAGAQEFSDLAVNASSIKPLSLSAGIPMPFAAAITPKGSDTRWYGADSRQARMQFTAYVLYEIPPRLGNSVSQILSNPGQRQKITEIVNLQLQHMYGAFTMHPGFVDNPGIPSGDYNVTLLKAEKLPDGLYAKVSYSYDDVTVFSSKLFRGSAGRRIQFVLPKDPVTIYSKGFPRPSSKTNLCTDEHYNGEGDFWYFWNPYQEGCPISGDDLVEVKTDLKPLPVTRNTYPEYEKLYGGSGDELRITYIVGVDEGFQSGDLGKQTFNDAFTGLKNAGFDVTVDKARRKELSLSLGEKTAAVEMLLMDPNSAEFAHEAVRGMQDSDIFLYDGHSGLGGYLNPERLAEDTGQKLKLPKNKYQIFVFQGCSTYAYYNTAFFNLKRSSSDPKGTKNLDIITNGIGADFAVGADVDVAFLTSITNGERPSWQEIINNIRAAEGDSSALSHINGDEDNPKTP